MYFMRPMPSSNYSLVWSMVSWVGNRLLNLLIPQWSKAQDSSKGKLIIQMLPQEPLEFKKIRHPYSRTSKREFSLKHVQLLLTCLLLVMHLLESDDKDLCLRYYYSILFN